MTTMRSATSRRLLAGGLLTLAATIGAGPTRALSLQEPPAVFYGRITGTGSVQPFLVTQGEMRWTLRRADGTTLVLHARLWPQNDGAFSYRLNVPQQALANGLTVSADTLPLRKIQETHAIAEILVDGLPARIAGGSESSFAAAQFLRAATHRLDLEVALVAADADGDGLPDWWEAKHGGELAAEGDADGDGLTNLAEYRTGTDPLRDSRRPALLTSSVPAYADATTGVFLRVADSDSAPEALVYTLTQVPAGAELRLRNARQDPQQPDIALIPGDSFRQSDVLAGRLVLVHTAASIEPSGFAVTLSDGTPGLEAVPATVTTTFYRPSATLLGKVANAASASGAAMADGMDAAPGELRRVRDYLLGRDQGAILRDVAAETVALALSSPSARADAGTYTAQFGSDRPQVFRAGRGDDTLEGGLADDLLAGGAGHNRLSGGQGSDRFVIAGADAGSDTLTDFRPADGDILDLTECLQGDSRNLRDYVRVAAATDGVRLELDRNGDGSGFTDRVVTLVGLTAADADLHELAERGSLVTGTLALPPRIVLSAAMAEAAENGPRKGEFLLVRSGDTGAPLTVRFTLRGSAVNGVDFVTVADSLSFAPGQREARLTIEPYADSQPEPSETVEVALVADAAYEVGPGGPAIMTIADLRPVVRIEALEALATLRPSAAGAILVTRDTVVDRSLLVRLDFGGNAANGVDYQSVPRFLNLVPGQTTAVIPIQPAAAAAGREAARSVRVTLVSDAGYLIAGAAGAEVLLVPERTTFASWRTSFFPGVSGSLEAFGAADAGGTGISNARRYAFGMDPQQPDSARLPKVVVRDGHLTLDVWRRPGAADLDFVAEVSSDLRSWNGAPEKVERVVLPEHGGSAEVITFRAVAPLTPSSPLFMNLRVVIRP